jgi:hypothetical protein
MGRPLKTTEAQRRSIRSELKAGQTVSAVPLCQYDVLHLFLRDQ